MKYAKESNGKTFKLKIIFTLLTAITTISVAFLLWFSFYNTKDVEVQAYSANVDTTSLLQTNATTAKDIVATYFPIGQVPKPIPPSDNSNSNNNNKNHPPTGEKLMALTFDDGPNTTSTLRILDILKQYNIKATFFVLGTKVEQNPAVLQRIVDEGHQVGNHSYSHPNLLKLSDEEIASQIKATNDLVKSVSNYDITILRPPYGSYDQRVEQIGRLRIVLWNIDSLDWKLREKNAIVNQINASLRVHSILLMHDIYDSSADAFEAILPSLIEQNYKFVTIDEYSQLTGN